MMQVFANRYSQTDLQCFVKNSLFSLRRLKRILSKHGLFRSNSNLPFTTLCDIFQVRYFFCRFLFSVHSVDSRNYSYIGVDSKGQNYVQSNNITLKFWCLLSFPLQILLKQFLLLIVTDTIIYFKLFKKNYRCFALFHRKKQKAAKVCQDTG